MSHRLLVASLLASLFVDLRSSAAADDRCTIPAQDDNPVVKACAHGGRPEAKKLMKDMVKDAKARGGKFTCEQCHKDLENWELTPNARADMKKLLDVLKK